MRQERERERVCVCHAGRTYQITQHTLLKCHERPHFITCMQHRHASKDVHAYMHMHAIQLEHASKRSGVRHVWPFIQVLINVLHYARLLCT